MGIKNVGFYERYKKEQKQKKIEEQFRKKYNISDNKTVIFEKKSKIDKLLGYLKNIIKLIIRLFIYFSILGLSSIGATVLLNESLREPFLQVLKVII